MNHKSTLSTLKWSTRCFLLSMLFAVPYLHCDTIAATPQSIAEDAAQKQLEQYRQTQRSYRYLIQKSDKNGTVVREEVVTPYGRVARLRLREGKTLSQEEDTAERQRLIDFLQSADALKKKRKQGDSAERMTNELIAVMPRAMLYSYRAGQPQLQGIKQPQIVIDFIPNPAFHPSSTAQEALRGLRGTFWVDRQTHYLVRMEGEIFKDTNLIFGLVAKIYPGGHLAFEQHAYAPNEYAYSLITMDLSIRELMLRNVKVASTQRALATESLQDGLSLEEAVHLLLDHPMPLPSAISH